MEEFFYLPPRAQALANRSAVIFEKSSRFAVRKFHLQDLGGRPVPRRHKGPFRLLSCLLGGAIAGCGSNYIVTSSTLATGSGGSALSSISCAQSSISGSANVVCTVTLSAAAGGSGLAVSLSSNDSAVTVPGSLTVPAGAASAEFTANVAAVAAARRATLTASAEGITQTYVLTLNPVLPGLTLGASSISFGTVKLNTPATQPVTLTSSGAAALTISAATATGAGFSISGISFPVTLNPEQTVTLYVQFEPLTAGTATGLVTLTSNASPDPATISLSGTGAAGSYQVNLTWIAPTHSSNPVVGYNIYRATSGSSFFQLLNSTLNMMTSFTDSNVSSGIFYTYFVESVDDQGNQSVPSNIYTVSIP